jgi:hypothetical protein
MYIIADALSHNLDLQKKIHIFIYYNEKAGVCHPLFAAIFLIDGKNEL